MNNRAQTVQLISVYFLFFELLFFFLKEVFIFVNPTARFTLLCGALRGHLNIKLYFF